jgi:hypothetical protein
MLSRIIHFLIGAAAAAGGGYLVWTHRTSASEIFPPAPGGAPWLLMVGLAAVCIGVVFLVASVIPRPQRAARLAAEAARRQDALTTADAYYAERARAADRDWRSGDLPAPPPPQTQPAPAAAASVALAAAREESPPPAKPAAAKPVATSTPPAALPQQPFPAAATLAPIPRTADPPPRPLAPPPPRPLEPQQEAASEAEATDSVGAIRKAIAEGRLEDAEKMLSRAREAAEGEALAELTGLAGDHAAAAGRQSNAKWLWRLALKRFGEANAMASPAARAVSESLRLSDQ